MGLLTDLVKYNPLSVSLAETYVNARTRGAEAYIFMATTGSRLEAVRAGKYPEMKPIRPSITAVAAAAPGEIAGSPT